MGNKENQVTAKTNGRPHIFLQRYLKRDKL